MRSVMMSSQMQLGKFSAAPSLVRRQRATLRTQAVATQAPAIAATKRVQLGDSDLMVSECCLGTMTWGSQNSEAEAHEQLSYAFDLGVNFMDTAEIYPIPPTADKQGRTDKYIGTWMKSRKRDDIILASKVAGYSDRQTHLRDSGDLVRVTAAQIEESVNKSLARLDTDYLDLLQVHWPDRYVSLFGATAYDINLERPDDVPFEEQLRGLENVIKAGKVRHIGVSNESSWGVCQWGNAAEKYGLPKIVSIQNSYSLLVRGSFETDLAEVCAPRQMNVGLLAYSPLAGGSLSGKYIKGNDPKARFNLFPGYMERFNKSLAREAVAEYAAIAQKYGITPTQLALAFCKSRWFVASTIIGATSLPQLKENVEAFDVELSAECLEDIQTIFKKYRDPSTAP